MATQTKDIENLMQKTIKIQSLMKEEQKIENTNC